MNKDMNHYNTFIEVADDCPAVAAEIPAQKGADKTVPVMQYEMLSKHPYKYTQEDVLFEVFAKKNGVADKDKASERVKFFSKGQPCLRCSALGKRYGWGIHHDAKGKVAIYAMESKEYKKLAGDKSVKHVKAMRSARG